ncbi:unnamed protein product [Parajaminaea phylloscopi]
MSAAAVETLDKHSSSTPSEEHIEEKGAGDGKSVDPLRPEEDAQRGVQAVEAITLSWNKSWLSVAFLCFWAIYFVRAFESTITGNLGPYILSDFSEAPLVTTISTVANVLSGALLMPIARMLNTWDRGHGFALMATLATLGLVLSAACNNIYAYAASQVLYNVGFTGMIFAVDVLTLDTSTLRDRGIAYAFTSSPYIIAAFAAPKAAERFNETNWRWGYGTWAIVLPIVCAPLYVVMAYHKRKAKATGVLKSSAAQEKKTPLQSLRWFVIEFDLAGVILLGGGMALFLLPFTIAGSAEDQWKSAHIIAMLVVGAVMMVSFGLYERFLSPKPLLPYHLLTSRTLLFVCMLNATYTVANYCWNIYFSEYLQVVYNRSLADAGYIGNIFTIVNGVWLFGCGYLLRRTCRFRWMLWCAVPIYMLFEGLLIYFRREGTSIGYIIMCQVFMAISGGSIIICGQVAVASIAAHQDAASALAMLNVFGTIGVALGSSISGAIWTNLMPKYLVEYLPAETTDIWADIYASLDVQLSYPIGDATRSAIIHAYESTQTWMLTAGTLIMALAVVFMFLVRDVRLDREQVKGVVL